MQRSAPKKSIAKTSAVNKPKKAVKKVIAPKRKFHATRHALSKPVSTADHMAVGKAFYEAKKATGDFHEHSAGFLYRFIGEGQTGKGHSNNSSPKPTPSETVKVHYAGRLIDNEDGTPGKEFDSSYKRGEPISFPLNRVIKGWGLAVQEMSDGDKITCILPESLAYGSRGAGRDIPGGATLVFDIEKVGPDANMLAGMKVYQQKKESGEYNEHPNGFLYKWLVEPSNGPKPLVSDDVTIHYHGTRTIDGAVFDSSVARGEKITFPLSQLVQGWQMAVPLMTNGSKIEIILPPSLAYGDHSPSPMIPANSHLTFEIELFNFTRGTPQRNFW
jgi:FKBP-type peptidyl-prolyl cis-trans isomerase